MIGIWVDCDADTLLIKVNPAGPACHTGAVSCFFRTLEELEIVTDILARVFATIEDRKANPKPGSYTNRLLDAGEDEIVKKIGEEAVEVILAVKGQGNERVISELADLTYHCLVLLAQRGLSPTTSRRNSNAATARHNIKSPRRRWGSEFQPDCAYRGGMRNLEFIHLVPVFLFPVVDSNHHRSHSRVLEAANPQFRAARYTRCSSPRPTLQRRLVS